MSTHNICYGTEIRKNNFQVYTIIWGPFFNQFGSRSDKQNATSDLYPGSLSHIGTELGPIYLHYLGL